MNKTLNVVVPMAGAGSKFKEAGYSFPKPLIDVGGKPMIQLVIENLKLDIPHRFIFICLNEHYEKYSLREIFNNVAGENHEVITLNGSTSGAACTVMTAIDLINNEDDLLIANSDQITDINLGEFIDFARKSEVDGAIMTFSAGHPKWSYAKVNKDGFVYEVAEKRVISNNATAGLYYFSQGNNFVKATISMIEKDIRVNNEFYVCPVYNELVISGGRVKTWPIESDKMHGLGTPEDLNQYIRRLELKK